MNSANEQLSVRQSSGIRDIKIVVNTGDGVNQFTTQKINGFIKSIIIRSEKSVSITIDSELGYNLMDKREHRGVENILLRAPTFSTLGNRYTDHVDSYAINEKLVIIVQGAKGSDVEVIFRLI